jgi:hypothetical protein
MENSIRGIKKGRRKKKRRIKIKNRRRKKEKIRIKNKST